MMIKSKKYIGLYLFLLIILAFAGCNGDGNGGTDDVFQLESGRYIVKGLFGHDPADEDLLMAIEMVIDRDAGTAVFELQDGTQVTANLSIRADLLACCCTMQSCLQGEVSDLDVDPLALESMEFVVPVLVANMYGTDGEVLLREDDGSALYSYYEIKHILFTPAP